ncbi:MAG: hypothetical protein VB013_01080 [Anaerolineaceae bacterium]|nr:hypothetical protein [Anaerolineaceae bacterium]
MSREPLFKGLVVDDNEQPVGTSVIGSEPCYVVNDAGFLHHIPSEQVDRVVLEKLGSQISGNEDMIAEQTAKMMGQDDLFTHAIIQNQLKNIGQQFDQLLEAGIPEESRVYLGMTGFKVVINFHGEVVRIDQPSAPADGGAGGEDE